MNFSMNGDTEENGAHNTQNNEAKRKNNQPFHNIMNKYRNLFEILS